MLFELSKRNEESMQCAVTITYIGNVPSMSYFLIGQCTFTIDFYISVNISGDSISNWG